MTKNTMMDLVAMLNGAELSDERTAEIKVELEKELNRNAERAQANRELYASVHDIVMNGFAVAGKPITLAELYEEVQSELPKGFSKGKVQYAVTNLWANELVKTEGPAHAPRFTVRVVVDGLGEATAAASTRKEAESLAASRLLSSLT